MDSGLGVQWPLSPYTTALAAGALFAFCVVLWRHHSNIREQSKEDSSGQYFSSDLDPKEEQEEGGKSAFEQEETERRRRSNNFPVLAFRERKLGFNCENTCLLSPLWNFGAIPRRKQKCHSQEDSNLPVLRFRNTGEGDKKCRECNPDFACICPKSLFLGNEVSNLNAGFELSISPHLHQYLKQFYRLRDVRLSEISRKDDFENFDVLINPEILKNKPITRSALTLALDRQLHRILNNEPICEIKVKERSVQTSWVYDKDGDNSGDRNLNLDIDDSKNTSLFRKVDDDEYNKKLFVDASLWDSGFCEKSFEEYCSTPGNLNQFQSADWSADGDNISCFETKNVSQRSAFGENSSRSDSRYSVNANEILKYKSGEVSERDNDNSANLYADTSQRFNYEEMKIANDVSENINPEGSNTDKFETPKLSANVFKSEENCNETNLGNLNSRNFCNPSNAFYSGDFGYPDKTNPESENEINDLLNLYTDILEDFNACEIKIPAAGNENVTCGKNRFVTIPDEIAKQKVKSIHGEDGLDLNKNNSQTKSSPSYHSREKKESPLSPKCYSSGINSTNSGEKRSITNLLSIYPNSNLTCLEEAVSECSASEDESLFRDSNTSVRQKIPEPVTRVSEVYVKDIALGQSAECCSITKLENSDLESIQKMSDSSAKESHIAQSPALESERSEEQSMHVKENAVLGCDVMQECVSRDPAVFDEERAFRAPRQMDRETGERSVAVESTVTTETTLRTNGDARISTALVSRLTLDDWSKGCFEKEDSVSIRTTVSDEIYKPPFEEFVPLKSSERVSRKGDAPASESFEQFISFETKNESNGKLHEVPKAELPPSPRLDRLKGLLNRDEERRARSKFHHLPDSGHVGGAMEGEWDRLLRDVLASVSELERWERRHCDVSADAEDAEQQHHLSQSDSSFTMEEEALSPTKGETPTKVKSLRFKLDPDVFDVPSDDSFYDDDDDDDCRRNWRKQSRYRTFSSLELNDEPVRLVSVHASVVPAGQKMVARPVGIDLRVRLTEERQSKRAHVSTSPSQAKRRSPVSDRGVGWCQELSPVTENVDWRETFTPVASESKSVPNGILKTPSPKSDPAPAVESPNPFKLENGVVTNGVSSVPETKRMDKPKPNGLPWKPSERKPFSLPRRKFEPDPEAVERITGYKTALSKPPLPPPVFNRANANNLILRNKAEQARKQYLDSKAALSAAKMDGTKKFQQFLTQAQSDRARIVTSVPDLVAIERAVTEQWAKEKASSSPRESPPRQDSQKADDVVPSRGSTPDDAWTSYVQSCRQHLGRRSQSMSYLETDIDIIPVLDEDDKCHSTSALDEPDEALPDPDESDVDRSREDLDDSGRAKSEHELRIEKSLRSLPLPDWYKRSEKTKTGFLLGNSAKEKRGWAAAKSLASSTSSLASCGLRRPVRSLRSSRENIPWSRSSASPDGPTLSLALAKAFREPYLGWRARTPTSSGVSSSPRASPPSWGATTDDEANGVSFDGEDAFGRTTSSEDDKRDEPLSLDDTGADAVTVSMDTNDPVKLPGGEDTCDDINNMSMDTCELFDASVVVPVDEDPSPQADTGDDIDNLSTDTTTNESRKLDPKLKRYSYSQSIYHSEWDEEEESRGDHKVKTEDIEHSPSCPDHKVVWIESSFVGSRTTTSIMVLPQKSAAECTQERPASR